MLSFLVALVVLACTCAMRVEAGRADGVVLLGALVTFGLAAALLHGRLGAPQRWVGASFSLLGSAAAVSGLWIFASLMMAFACDNARSSAPIDAAFRVLYAWRYVAPPLVLMLGVAVLAGKQGVPKKAWCVLAAACGLWFSVALAWLIAGLRTS